MSSVGISRKAFSASLSLLPIFLQWQLHQIHYAINEMSRLPSPQSSSAGTIGFLSLPEDKDSDDLPVFYLADFLEAGEVPPSTLIGRFSCACNSTNITVGYSLDVEDKWGNGEHPLVDDETNDERSLDAENSHASLDSQARTSPHEPAAPSVSDAGAIPPTIGSSDQPHDRYPERQFMIPRSRRKGADIQTTLGDREEGYVRRECSSKSSAGSIKVEDKNRTIANSTLGERGSDDGDSVERVGGRIKRLKIHEK